ncbi:hypothetical protein LAZ67_7003622 [Cordylochernes scorpioides]|uniref:Uncharacterized protein n=1 Tax=Cordylochernes scorpioides TaxID=51811 RepID=A0ABY6KS87_9ARAC|nr:hypothetical protein LAZ67_7003622 [Cordylochernes scorpioides]
MSTPVSLDTTEGMVAMMSSTSLVSRLAPMSPLAPATITTLLHWDSGAATSAATCGHTIHIEVSMSVVGIQPHVHHRGFLVFLEGFGFLEQLLGFSLCLGFNGEGLGLSLELLTHTWSHTQSCGAAGLTLTDWASASASMMTRFLRPQKLCRKVWHVLLYFHKWNQTLAQPELPVGFSQFLQPVFLSFRRTADGGLQLLLPAQDLLLLHQNLLRALHHLDLHLLLLDHLLGLGSLEAVGQIRLCFLHTTGRKHFSIRHQTRTAKTATTPETIEKVHNIVLDDRRVCEIAEAVGIWEERVWRILHEELGMQKLCVR